MNSSIFGFLRYICYALWASMRNCRILTKTSVPCIELNDNLPLSSLKTGTRPQMGQQITLILFLVSWRRTRHGGGSRTPISHTTQLHLIIICFSQPEKKPTTRFVCLNPAEAEYFHTYVWIA